MSSLASSSKLFVMGTIKLIIFYNTKSDLLDEAQTLAFLIWMLFYLHPCVAFLGLKLFSSEDTTVSLDLAYLLNHQEQQSLPLKVIQAKNLYRQILKDFMLIVSPLQAHPRYETLHALVKIFKLVYP